VRRDPARLPEGRRNMLWMMFTDGVNRERMPRWEPAARTTLSQFRVAAGQRPDDPRFAELAAALEAASPEFRAWWGEYPERYFQPARIAIRHPEAGRIALEMFQLRLVEHPELVMVMQVPASPLDADRVAALLGTSAGRGTIA
jgi:MmyB-like transcription regulator ligand binding domain